MQILSFSLPSSKSLSNRILFALALYPCAIEVHNLSKSTDTQVFIEALKLIKLLRENQLYPSTSSEDKVLSLDMRDCGLALRFFLSLAALQARPISLLGSKRLLARPLAPLVDALRVLGARIHQDQGAWQVQGPLKGSYSKLYGKESSQFLSSLMMVAPCIHPEFTLHFEPPIPSFPYVQMTQKILSLVGWKCKLHKDSVSFEKVPSFSGVYTVEKDLSCASYLLGASLLSGQGIVLEGVDPEKSWQGDRVVFAFMEALGATGKVNRGGYEFIPEGKLHAFDRDFTHCPDLALTFGVLAACIPDTCYLRGVDALVYKECNRLQALKEGLEAMGVKVEKRGRDLRIQGRKELKKALIPDYQDHRVVMSFSLLTLVQPDIQVMGKSHCQKSYPHFFDDLARFLELRV